MDFKEFLINIAKFNWGLIASNTYHQYGKEYIYNDWREQTYRSI